MFDTAFASLLTKESPRILQWADLYMKSFYPKQLYSGIKASHTVYRTNGIRHLLLILKNSRHAYLPKGTASADQFDVTVESWARSVSRTFDPVQSGIVNRNFFVKSNAAFTEVLYLSNLVNPLKLLPADISYYSGWRDIKPLRMVESSAMPLSLNVDNQTLNYAYADTGYGVFALDPSALILKYESFRREFFQPGDTEDACMVRYLVSDVINPCLLSDSFALWMRNLYRNVLTEKDPTFSYSDSYWPTETTQIVGAGYVNFLEEMESVKKGLMDKSVHPNRILWSLPVSSDNTPLAQWIEDLNKTTALPDQYQYHWVEGLARFSWLELIWIIAKLTGDSVRYKSFARQLWHPLNQWVINHPWTSLKDRDLRDLIEKRATGMLAQLNRDIKA